MAKVTAAAGAKVRFDGFIARDSPKEKNFNAGPLVEPEALVHGNTDHTSWNVHALWMTDGATAIEARYGGNDSSTVSGPPNFSALSGPAPHYDEFTGISSVNAQGYADTST